jgi:SET domain-containing protein
MPPVSKTPWFVVRSSKIHGEGVFASRDIPRGTRVIEYVGERISKAEAQRRAEKQIEDSKSGLGGAVYIFEATNRHDIDGNVPWNPARLINHSCQPNCKADNIRGRIWISAIRRIKEGEELSYDYGYDPEHYEDHPCLCGSGACFGYIVGRQYRRKIEKTLRKFSPSLLPV